MLSTSPVISSRPVRWIAPAAERGCCLAASGLQHGVAADGDQQPRADPVRRVPEGAGEAVAEQQAQERHPGLEYAEDHADANAGPRISTSDADAHRGSEVRQAECNSDQQEGEHGTT